jgi:hypothetical protein
MKEYTLIISPELQISFNTKSFITLWRSLRLWLWRFSFWLGAGLLAVLPVASIVYAMSEQRVASVSLYHILTLCFAGGLVIIWQTIQGQWKTLADPQGFLGVLSFALIAIISWIVSPLFVEVTDLVTYRYINTFGSITTKAIAGLTIIGLVALYYLANQFINSRQKLLGAVSVLAGGLLSTSFILLLYPQIKNTEIFISLAAAAALVFLAIALYLPLPKLPSFALSLISLTAVQLSVYPNKWQVTFALLAASLIWAWFEYWAAGAQLKFKKQTTVGENIEYNKLYTIFGLSLALLVLLGWQIASNSAVAATQLRALVDVPLANLQGADWRGVVFGNGFASVKPANTLWQVILSFQGLLGLSAYLILAVTGMIGAVRSLASKQFARILVPGFFFLLALGIFANLHLVLVMWTWLLFSVFVAAGKLAERVQNSALQAKVKLGSWSLPRWWQLTALLSIPIFVFLWTVVNNQLLILLANAQI